MLLAKKLIYGSAPPSPSICNVASPAPVPNTVNFFVGLAVPIPTFPDESITNLFVVFVASLILKRPFKLPISKSGLLSSSTNVILGLALVILIFPFALNSPDKLVTPVVTIF